MEGGSLRDLSGVVLSGEDDVEQLAEDPAKASCSSDIARVRMSLVEMGQVVVRVLFQWSVPLFKSHWCDVRLHAAPRRVARLTVCGETRGGPLVSLCLRVSPLMCCYESD